MKKIQILFAFFGSLIVAPSASALDALMELSFPLNCQLDENCFLQQFVDLDQSSAIADPFCNTATYNGHKGTDIRLRYLADIEKNVAVLAAANGIVKAVRNNISDKLIKTKNDREKVKNKECGNGLVIAHGNGIETQYCHLKYNSISKLPNEKVLAGDTIGYVGVSGLTEFPHLHFTVRKNRTVIDPFTGKQIGDSCSDAPSGSWWQPASKLISAQKNSILLDSGLSGSIVKHNQLKHQKPESANISDQATVGWVSYVNLRKGDQIFISLDGPKGPLSKNLSKPLNRSKATWSGYVGKKRRPLIGTYRLKSYILRDGKKLKPAESVFSVMAQ